MFPEQRFLRDLYPELLPENRLAARFAQDGDVIRLPLREHIAAALEQLTYRQRGILEMRYGLGDGFAYTLAEVAQVFRLTRERIRQLQARAIRKLRKHADALRDFVYDFDS
jgi:RNA polymerase primary sigma factor